MQTSITINGGEVTTDSSMMDVLKVLADGGIKLFRMVPFDMNPTTREISRPTNKSGAPRASAWRTLPDGRKVRKSDPLWIAHIATLASDGQEGQVEAAVAAVEATVAAP